MKMYIDGREVDSPEMTPVVSPYTGETFECIPQATPEQVEQALAASVRGAAAMGHLTGYERSLILMRAADLLAAQVEDIAHTISLEEGKPLVESRGEVGRMPDLLRLCAFEGSQVRGETLPVDAQSGVRGKLAFTLRIPCGVVVAITPFNYPLLLVLHKVGPALAAGNAVILKPASQAALTALKLTDIFRRAGLPENGLQCITGPGSMIGMKLCSDSRVRKISFTGSTTVGRAITQVAGVKKLSLELGSNAPLIVLRDADIAQAAEATAAGGYVNAGQVCISTQRILVEKEMYGDFLDALRPSVEAIKVGDPLDEGTRLSAMVCEKEAERVGAWIEKAVREGARVITGGKRDRAVFAPTIVADVKPDMRISREELFGPVVAVTPVDDVDRAIELANDSQYGLSSGIYTRDISRALKFALKADTGNVMINWNPLWRADLMPYGGLKQSGIGKEGPRYAIKEMTELKTVVVHGIEA
ncbi:MAG: aldehyde dehydrogenase family protein [Vicinamibacteraceae bacterium]